MLAENERTSGILLHPTSLPGRFGIGDLGEPAYRFVDFLCETGLRLWQMLPLGAIRGVYDNSPYQCLSIFAGNTMLISLDKLAEEGLLERSDLEPAPDFHGDTVDYETVTRFKVPLLKKSFQLFHNKADTAQCRQFETFCQRNSFWLDDYSLFLALKETHQNAAWNTWDQDIKWREPDAIKRWRKKLAYDIESHKYQQYQFFKQWSDLKSYCRKCSIRLIGDIPLFIAFDSADVWLRPELFYLDENGQPTVVAGVPPDYFSKTGQRWGNPLYRWDTMAKEDYQWWVERFHSAFSIVDIIRLDHFRGFEKYWEIPAAENTAINGRWVTGPGADFFKVMRTQLGEIPIIAEDLGVITPEVDELRERFGFTGMRVLQFAFGNDPKADEYKPHNYPRNCVVYTGTHDNDTTLGWFQNVNPDSSTQSQKERDAERKRALKYLGTDGHEINWDFIRLALQSVAAMAIIPLQDVLGLGSEARMNIPGTASGNWRWRFSWDMITPQIKSRLLEMVRDSGR
jgi:4-alpha-glucanotransferase